MSREPKQPLPTDFESPKHVGGLPPADAAYDFYNGTGSLPRTVPQDPAAVKREQEVREATAEAMRASLVGRGPSPDELRNIAGPGPCVIDPFPHFEQPPPLDFGKVQTMTLRPGDTLVLHCDQRISRAVFDKLRKQFREQFPDHRVVILEKGLRLTVAREEPTE